MKNRWVTKRLGDVATKIGSGATPLGGEAAYKASGISLIRSMNVYDEGFRAAGLARIDEEQASRLSNVVVEADDVLINITGASVARCCLATSSFLPARVNQHVAIIRPAKAHLLPTFLRYQLISPSYKDRLLNTGNEGGSTRQAITKADLECLSVEYPESLAEQQRIVSMLDESFEGIATAKSNAEKNLQNARALFESHLQSVFTQGGKSWTAAKIGDHIRFIDYRGKTPEKTESGLRLITAKNVKMGYLQTTPREFVAPDSYTSWMTRGIPRLGDVLFTTEAPLANVAQLDTAEKVVFAQRIIIMQPDAQRLKNTFLKYLLMSHPVQQRIHDKGTGATVKGIKASLLKTIEICFPKELTDQQTIVEKLDSLRGETLNLETIYRRKLSALEALRKSLLDQALTRNL